MQVLRFHLLSRLLYVPGFLIERPYFLSPTPPVGRTYFIGGKTLKRKGKHSKAVLCALLSSAVLCQIPGMSWAEGEDNLFDFDPIVVTATKTPVKLSESNANMTVITRKDIEEQHYADLSEALRNVPGVTINNYGTGIGHEASNMLRINGSDKIVVLVDGVRVDAAGVNFAAAAYSDLDNVEKIEVLKGAAASLYGANAKGGVIQIITRKAEGNKSTLTYTGGSYDKENYAFMNQGKAGDYSWVVTSQKDIMGDYKDANGTAVPEHRNAETTTFKLTKAINEKSDITFDYQKYQSDYMYSGTNENLNWRNLGNVDNSNWKLIYNNQLTDNLKNRLTFYNGVYDNWFQWSNNAGTSMEKVKTMRLQDEFTQTLADNHTVTGGFEYSRDKVVSKGNKKLSNSAYYVQDEWNLDRQWKLTSGVRYDDSAQYGSNTSPHVNLGYKANEDTSYYVSYNKYFIVPTPDQVFNNTYGNNNLKAEKGDNLEFGVNHRLSDTLSTTFHMFKRSSSNAVFYDYNLWKYVNSDEKVHGWDIQLNKQVTKQLSTYVGYTHTTIDATIQQAENVDGYVPKGYWNVGADYRQERYDIHLQGRGVSDKTGPQNGTAYSNYFPESTYWVWDFALNYKLSKDAKTFLRVNNLFNKFYAEQSNASNRPGWGGNPGEWYTSPGRNYQLGVQYQF